MTDQLSATEDRHGKHRLLPMEEIDRLLRVSAVRQELAPMECRSSWLVPIRAYAQNQGSGPLYLTGFLYPVSGLMGQLKRVMRPRFQWTIDSATGRIVEVVDCSFRDFAAHIQTGDEIGILTPELLPAPTVSELEKFRADTLNAYDSALPVVFTSPSELSNKTRQAVVQLKQLLRRGIEPFLLPFYHALNPAFFAWLDQF